MKTTKKILAIVITLMMIIPTSMFFSVTSSAGHPEECPDCGGTYWEPYITTVDPTCETPGYGIMRCGACHFSTGEYEEIPPYGHFPGRYYVDGGALSQVCALCKTWTGNQSVALTSLNGNSRIRAIAGYFNAYQGAGGTYYSPSWLKDGDAAYINTNVSDLFERVAATDGSWYIIGKGGDDTWYHYSEEFKSTYCMPNIILASQVPVDGNILDAGVTFTMHSIMLGDAHANFTNTGWTYNTLYGSGDTCSNLISYAYTFRPITQRLSHGKNDMWNDGIVQNSTRGIEKSVKDAGGGFLCNFVGKTVRACTNTDLICYFFMPVVESGTVPAWVGADDAFGNAVAGARGTNIEESYTYTFNQAGMNYSYHMENGIAISFEPDENNIVRMIINDHVVFTCGGDRSNRKVTYIDSIGVERHAEQPLTNVGPAMVMNYFLGVDGYSALAVNGCNYPDVNQAEAEYFADFTLYDMDGIPANASAQAVAQKTVTFDANGGEAVASRTVDKGTTITLPSTTKTNVTFAGWTDGSNVYQAGASYTVNADVTLTAIWKAVATFDANGGTGTVAPITVDAGSEITIPGGETLSRPGYEFQGWTFSAGSSTVAFRAGAKMRLQGNQTFYAVWKQSSTPVTNYTVSFNTAGGTACAAQTVAAGTTITLPTTTRDGYTFVAWTLNGQTYAAGASYTVNGNVTFVATWQENEAPYVGDIAVEKIGGYDVKVVGLDASTNYTIRYATGTYTSVSAVKNGTNAGFVTARNATSAVVTLPTKGVHTIAIQGGAGFIGTVTIDTEDLRVFKASSEDLNLKVENLDETTRYIKLYQNGAAVLTFAAKSFSSDGLKTWADIAVPAAGTYDVQIVYTSGNPVTGTVTLTAPEATITTNGRIFTVADFGANNVSYMRLAKGVITTANGMKAASDLRTYGAKYFKADTAAFAALDAVNGESTTYTVQISYASGYSQFINFDITPTVPVITGGKGTITIANAGSVTGDYYIDWVRVAPGVQTSLYAIRHAAGSQVKKTADIANDKIVFTGLSAGTYSIFYLYDGWNLSEGLTTTVVG